MIQTTLPAEALPSEDKGRHTHAHTQKPTLLGDFGCLILYLIHGLNFPAVGGEEKGGGSYFSSFLFVSREIFLHHQLV